ncbi:FecR family protein [Pedobacter nototheniae]|uniref:FecR family protein n=1 Tax=Pedobacter nototheniae TaxID=2488994 RepID=UPI00103CC176|nr:FecR family protein [Pedobacter nototheniae]
MNQRELQSLIEKYLEGNCTPNEIVLLESWYLAKSKQDKLPVEEKELTIYKELIWQNIRQNIDVIEKPASNRKRFFTVISVAASITLTLFIGGYYLIVHHQKERITKIGIKEKQDILPGTNKAMLVLSNGKQISLASVQAGIIAQEGNITVKKQGTNILSYKQVSNNNGDKPLAYNTISTPNGGQWPIIELPDGTKAFLDAASSISFPVSFNKERKVTITGQVYFEVIHDSKKPFRVTVKGITIEDLGTSFNVNAYDNESGIKTSLIEGSVSVAKRNEKLIIKPGEQALTSSGSDKILSKQVDIDEIIAWKNGLFQFNHTNIDVVMRQIARWYDVEIIYKEDVSKISFTGSLSRNLKLSKSLQMLSVTGLHFKIEGKKIIVTP